MKSKTLLLGMFASLLLTICAFGQVQITALTGTVYDQNGVGKVGAKLYVVKTIKDGALVSGVQAVATSTTGGAISLNVVRGSTVYLYSTDIPYFSARGPAGMPFAIQDVSSASLESLTLITSVMQAQGDTAAAGANGRPARVAGNTTSTPKYYRQVGSSGIAGVPTWSVPLLTELGDVQIGTPTNGQVLKYNSTLGKWTPQADSTGGGGGGGTALTVAEADGSPSVSDVANLTFDQSKGFTVTDQGSGEARISLSGVPYSALALTGAIVNGDLAGSINAAKIADGSVSSTRFQYLANVTSDLQTQLNLLAPKASPALTGVPTDRKSVV